MSKITRWASFNGMALTLTRGALTAIFAALAVSTVSAGREGTSAVALNASALTTPAGPPAKAALVRTRSAPRVSTIARGLEVPWEMAFLPDGRALITERPGRVRLMTMDRRLLLAATVPVTSGGEGGVLGLAVDPYFARNRFVYLYRTTAGNGENQVVRYRLVGVRLVSPMVIVRSIPAARAHNGGRIRFGPDRGLYISTGENQQPPLAQSRGSLGGKLLRVRSPTYRGRRAARPEVFSLGHRNPQGFDWQPRTGLLVSTDHGPSGFDGPHGDDEINIVRRGTNHGWPIIEGTQRRAGLTAPAVLYRSPLAPSGATFVHKPGSAWSGDFLVAALRGEQIRRVRLRGGRAVIDQPLFVGSFGRLRTVVEGPDGALYALTSNRGSRAPRPGDDRILRIVPPAG